MKRNLLCNLLWLVLVNPAQGDATEQHSNSSDSARLCRSHGSHLAVSAASKVGGSGRKGERLLTNYSGTTAFIYAK
ncbi:hypothetical protein [Desulforamulus reducens]|uniref:hypothetical protein n=1 Tax=Desulforamulus reducens TaxID=59610 RepID=UPI00059E0BF7|nr:hypothetical protein [Desulforamulus reducens]